MKRTVAFLLIALMVGSLFGCAKTAASNELWIVTEVTTWDRMNGQIAAVAEQFEKDHEGITVRIDILPTDEQERSVYLQSLRTQILRGKGPDAYLLPTSTQLMVDAPRGYTAMTVEPLFSDVVQAMDNGMFRDISSLYDQDEALGKEALKTTVMDAGVVDGKRYVLPLRYDIPVIYADMDYLVDYTEEDFTQQIDAILKMLQEEKDFLAACGFSRLSAEMFTQWLDYDHQKVALDADTIAGVMECFRDNLALAGEELFYYTKLNVRSYCVAPTQTYCRLYAGSLADLVEYAPVYQHNERQLAILPLRSVGGDVVAEVTYYGAVGSGCENPELAYAFVRSFLLEDSQWEENRPQSLNAVGEKGRKVSTANATQVPGLIEDGWPVRVKGSLAPLWIVRKRQFYNPKVSYFDKEIEKRLRKVVLAPLDDGWEQILEAEPDQVRFGGSMNDSFRNLLQSLNDPYDYAPLDVDIQALAEDFWWQLRWHVAEG